MLLCNFSDAAGSAATSASAVPAAAAPDASASAAPKSTADAKATETKDKKENGDKALTVKGDKDKEKDKDKDKKAKSSGAAKEEMLTALFGGNEKTTKNDGLTVCPGAKSRLVTEKKEHKFWDNQPVPKLGVSLSVSN